MTFERSGALLALGLTTLLCAGCAADTSAEKDTSSGFVMDRPPPRPGGRLRVGLVGYEANQAWARITDAERPYFQKAIDLLARDQSPPGAEAPNNVTWYYPVPGTRKTLVYTVMPGQVVILNIERQ